MTLLSLDDPPFAGRSGKGVRVAVVDSGVAPGHPHVGEVSTGYCILHDKAGDSTDRLGHGTAVAAAIREKAPGCEIVPVKVFDRALKTDAATLARAIEWAATNGARIINLSLGTANAEHRENLESALAFATAKGAVVVSALESDGVRWLPGSLPGVIAVVARPDLDRNSIEVLPGPQSPVSRLYGASIYPRPIPGVPKERNLSGISFSVANVSGFLARALEGGDPLP